MNRKEEHLLVFEESGIQGDKEKAADFLPTARTWYIFATHAPASPSLLRTHSSSSARRSYDIIYVRCEEF